MPDREMIPETIMKYATKVVRERGEEVAIREIARLQYLMVEAQKALPPGTPGRLQDCIHSRLLLDFPAIPPAQA